MELGRVGLPHRRSPGLFYCKFFYFYATIPQNHHDQLATQIMVFRLYLSHLAYQLRVSKARVYRWDPWLRVWWKKQWKIIHLDAETGFSPMEPLQKWHHFTQNFHDFFTVFSPLFGQKRISKASLRPSTPRACTRSWYEGSYEIMDRCDDDFALWKGWRDARAIVVKCVLSQTNQLKL